ncbi:hypothetical protein N7476_011601 [Penicillium atrosanguineum]|uniref:Uncharacterized protein n=1 Tax=Penicillium atrosanguineum TaxID=1132637 RepID=A0A9W9PMW4_9EURO|nr:hypothetical protein N7476_011601 [Penicillium atrosanguineum]
MGRRGPAAIYATRAEKNTARRDRYQRRRREGPHLSQECQSSVARASQTQLEQDVRDPQEPTPDGDSSPRSKSAPKRETAPDTLDVRPVLDPQPLLEGSLPLSNDIGFMADGSGVFDFDGENAQHQVEPITNNRPSAETILPVGDEPTEAITLINEHETDPFDISDMLADSDSDVSADSAYGSGGSDDEGSYSDQSSSEPENPDSLGVQLARQILQFQGCCPIPWGCEHPTTMPTLGFP